MGEGIGESGMEEWYQNEFDEENIDTTRVHGPSRKHGRLTSAVSTGRVHTVTPPVNGVITARVHSFHFGKSGFSAYFSRQIRTSGFLC